MAPPAIPAKRIESIDLLRGIVIIIMSIDHVRDYFHDAAYLFDPTNLSKTTPLIFATRWITHFCAPVFVLLAGTSAYISGARKSRKELSAFLFKRGLWLIFLEFFVISFGWTFNPAYPVFILQVIWAIGLSMIILSLAIYLPLRLILLISILCISAHNFLDTVHVPGDNIQGFLWAVLHERGMYSAGPFYLLVGYPIIPWLGMMLAGYCLGALYARGYDPVKRKRSLLYLGWGAIALFVLLRFTNAYGDPSPWAVQQNPVYTVLSFLNTSKYPPSFLYILMTLGPSFLFLAYAEKPLNAFTKKIIIFGRVPMFYYILHIFFIHLLGVAGAVISGRPWTDMVLGAAWVTDNPQLQGYGFSLLTVYVLWILVVVILYPLCKWYDNYKTHHREKKWLSYI
jgi:uncharacterized membrane protein